MEEDYWEGNDELCDTETKELEIRNSERRPHVIEDAPSRKAPTSSEEKNNWKKINWI